MADFLIGVDLGGTNLKTALVSVEGEVLQHDTRPTKGEEGPDAVIAAMEQAAREVAAAAGISPEAVLAVGVGSPGPLNWQTGVVFETPNLKGWRNVPLAHNLSTRLGRPVFVDNDANVACFGEFWRGAGQNVDSMVLLTLGTGVGGGIVLGGKLLRGPDGTAAEIGHMCVRRNGRQCGCGAKGCLEKYASVTGMVRTARKGIEGGHVSMLTQMCGGDLERLTGKMISEAVGQGDGFAAWVMQETGVWIGIGVGSLINLLNPEMVVLAGGMIAAGDVLFKPVRETARVQSFDVPGDRAEVVPAALGAYAGVIGAAGCALERAHETQ